MPCLHLQLSLMPLACPQVEMLRAFVNTSALKRMLADMVWCRSFKSERAPRKRKRAAHQDTGAKVPRMQNALSSSISSPFFKSTRERASGDASGHSGSGGESDAEVVP